MRGYYIKSGHLFQDSFNAFIGTKRENVYNRTMNSLKNEQRRQIKKETKFIKKHAKRKNNQINQKLNDKVPEKLEDTLNKAFEKAFILLFSKGDHWIEKTYNARSIKNKHTLNQTKLSLEPTRKNMRAFAKTTKSSSTKNILYTGISSTLFGILGIGLPDIPIFIVLIMKNLQEISLNYGFDPHQEKEKLFMLMIIEGAMDHENINQIDKKINNLIDNKSSIDLDHQIKRTSKALSHELLYLKFLQGIPIVGSVSGFYDSIYMKRISEYAKLKYQHRFLLTK